MISLLTLTSEIVYKLWNKKVNKENKVGTLDVPTSDYVMSQLESVPTISNAVIELRTRLLLAIGEPEKICENGGSEKNVPHVPNQKSNEEILRLFLIENTGKNGKLPAEKVIMNATGLTERQLRDAKTKLIESRFLKQVNSRVLKLNSDYVKG
ncbi:MAG TPA: hypothetical protein VK426_06395 [Methanobacterium sp.]|nr:hypothetical protein [Methanobacterium sp.]